MKPKHLLTACCLILPLVTQAAALQCKKFKPESKEVEAEHNQKGSGNGFNNELLAAKHVCQYQGTIKDAYAAFRADKKNGLGDSKAGFPRNLPPIPSKKTIKYKESGEEIIETWLFKKIGDDILITIDIGAMYPSSESVKLIPHGSRVTIEHRFYSP